MQRYINTDEMARDMRRITTARKALRIAWSLMVLATVTCGCAVIAMALAENGLRAPTIFVVILSVLACVGSVGYIMGREGK